MKSSLYLTAKVAQGNKIEIQNPNLMEGETVEIVIIISQPDKLSFHNNQSTSFEERQAFIKLPVSERRKILAVQAEKMASYYQGNTEWQELMAGDIIDY